MCLGISISGGISLAVCLMRECRRVRQTESDMNLGSGCQDQFENEEESLQIRKQVKLFKLSKLLKN